jgi:phosphopantothenate-cysteine ligase/phosphopantothenoylcysteine decarboxylase/phosphopantothenate--cysteine ligase
MRILVTAGNTQTPVDRVRCITNIFSGRTGTRLAEEAFWRGHAVTLLTSHPELAEDPPSAPEGATWSVLAYRTFEDLHRLMRHELSERHYDAVIHCAAVSDYEVSGVYARSSDGQRHVDVAAGKVKSQHEELWLRLKPTSKLVDKIRKEWGFQGVLVKFKLEVDVTCEELLVIAEDSRRHSQADLMVANTLEGMAHWAFVGSRAEGYRRVMRSELSAMVLSEVERLARVGVHSAPDGLVMTGR